jgi:glycosyltransferase involved in cell wall biosynthesis
VFRQSFRDFELVIVDDGSTDGTEEMVGSLGVPVRYYKQENQGDAAARNALLDKAKGKYISFIDSDDLLVDDAIERLMRPFEEPPFDKIVYGPYYNIDAEGKIVGRCKRSLQSGYITKHLFEDILIHSCGSMFPADLIRKEGGFDTSLRVCSDYAFWLRLSLNYPFVALDEPTFLRRRHESNISGATFENRLIELKVLEDFYFKQGGRGYVPKVTAMRRLSEECYRAAKSAMSEGRGKEAKLYSMKALIRCPLNFKAAGSLVKSWFV